MYKRLRFALRFAFSLLKKYYLLIIAGLVLGAASFWAVPKILSSATFLQPAQKVALISRSTPADLPLEVLKKLSVGLTILDESGYPLPAIAKEWQITDDGKTYVFHIDTSLKWHDQTPVKSSNLDLKFKDAQLETPSDDLLIIKLPDSFSPLPTVLSRPVFKKNAKPLVGVGLYRAGKIVRNGPFVESLSLEPTVDNLPRLKYFFYPSAATAKTAFKLGLVNQVNDLTSADEFRHWPNARVSSDSYPHQYIAAFFNLDHPYFSGTSGRNLRLALAYSTDKSFIPPQLRAIGPISPQSWVFNPEVKTYDLDPARAKAALARVEKVPSTIKISTLPAYLTIADKLKASWENLGIKIEIEPLLEIPTDFQVILAAQSIPADPDQYSLWHSTQKGTSVTNINNPRIDKLLEDGRKETDRVRRKVIYQDFQKYLNDEVPAIFLSHPETYTLVRN